MDIEALVKNARYSENLNRVINNLKPVKVLELSYESCYQGFVDISVELEDGRVFSYYYSYGSCSGCDEWESDGLSNSQIEAEMLKEATIFDSLNQFSIYLDSKKKK